MRAIAVIACVGVVALAGWEATSPPAQGQVVVSQRIDFHSWDSFFVRLIGQEKNGASVADLKGGVPAGVTDEWLSNAESRGLVQRQADRVVLTAAGRAAYAALPADTNQLSIGIDK